MSLDTVTDQIRSQLPQLAGLGYKVKFAIDDGGVGDAQCRHVLLHARKTDVVVTGVDADGEELAMGVGGSLVKVTGEKHVKR